MNGYDPLQHAQQRARRAENRADALEHINQQLYRVLAAILTDRLHDTPVDPLEYLQAYVDLDQALQ